MPGPRCRNFYILQYYHRGGDGRIALCCSKTGNLCVLKFPLVREGEQDALKKEAELWNRLWGTKCRVVEIKGRFSLLMPFCFHIRMISKQPIFCGLQNWNLQPRVPVNPLNDEEVEDFRFLDQQKLSHYQSNPMIAAEEALRCMLKQNVRHDDLKWAHVALLPSFSDSSDSFDLLPILIDLTRTTQVPNASIFLESLKSELETQLKEIQ